MGDHHKKKSVLIHISGTQTTMRAAHTSSPERPGRSEVADPTGAGGSREGTTYLYDQSNFPLLGSAAPAARRPRAVGPRSRGGGSSGAGTSGTTDDGNVDPTSPGVLTTTDGGPTVKDTVPAPGDTTATDSPLTELAPGPGAIEEVAEVTAVGPIAGVGSTVNRNDQEGGSTPKDAAGPVPAVAAIVNPDIEFEPDPTVEEAAVGPMVGRAGPSAGRDLGVMDGGTKGQESGPPLRAGWSPWDSAELERASKEFIDEIRGGGELEGALKQLADKICRG